MFNNDPPPGGGTPMRGNRSLIVLNENTVLKREIDSLKAYIEKVNNELKTLKFENQQLKIKPTVVENNTRTDQTKPTTSQNGSNRYELLQTTEIYETDEEELERETNWILHKTKNKKKKIHLQYTG